MSRLVLHCRSHSMTIDPILTTHQTNPQQCPICSRAVKSRGWDEYDNLHEKYHVSRQLVFQIDVFLREHLNNYSGSLESHLVYRLGLKMQSNGYTPITCSCSTCHSSFRYFAELPTQQTPPLYCPYCGKSTVVAQQDAELDCWEVLANAYHVNVPIIKVMYTMFQQQNARTHFADFVSLIKEQANVTK